MENEDVKQASSVLSGKKSEAEQVKAAVPAQVKPVMQAKEEPKLSIGLSELQALISAAVASAVQTSSKESATMLSEALKELRKPYVDPKQEENEKSMRASMKEVNERIARAIRQSQDNCPHLQGCNDLSAESGNRTCIVQHRDDTGVVIGICTNCQRVFQPGDSDYLQHMKRKSGNIMSQAGQRFFLNPAAVQAAGR